MLNPFKSCNKLYYVIMIKNSFTIILYHKQLCILCYYKSTKLFEDFTIVKYCLNLLSMIKINIWKIKTIFQDLVLKFFRYQQLHQNLIIIGQQPAKKILLQFIFWDFSCQANSYGCKNTFGMQRSEKIQIYIFKL